MRSNAGKATKSRTQHKSASSSTKSKRSPVTSKSSVSGESAAAQLDGVVDRTESTAVGGATDDQVLDEAGINQDLRGDDLSSKSVQLAAIALHQKVNEQEDDLLNESTELTAITLHQPWASLVALGYKQYETRDWPTNHRGLIVIHAGRKPKGKQELREHDKVVESFKDLLNEDCPYSAVVAIAELTDVILMTEEFINQQCPTELRCGDWKIGRYAFKLENIRAIAPIPATGKQGLWKFDQEAAGFDSLHLEPWNPADFGKVQHKAEADGQLNLLEFDSNEPPEPDDYPGDLEAFKKAYLAWVELQEGTAEEEYQHTTAEEIWNQSNNGDGLICVQGLEPASPTPELNCGESSHTDFVKKTNIAKEFLNQDFQEQKSSQMSEVDPFPSKTEKEITKQICLQQAPLVSPSRSTASDLEHPTSEIASPQLSEQSTQSDPSLQSSKMLPDCSLALIPPVTNPEPISDLSSTPYPRSGSMRNGVLSAAPTLPVPGVESDSLLLRSPGALSSIGETRPPGKTRLESQLQELRLILAEEVVAPEFLEAGYHLPTGLTNPAENRTAMELAQAQQLQSDHKSESPAEMATTATDEKPSETLLIGGLQQLDSTESNISLTLPPNIGSLGKAELVSLAQEQHQIISLIDRKQFELAVEKIHRVRITGEYLIEFKKRCQYGEFLETLQSHGIGSRTAQEYMMIAKNWETIEAKARAVALLPENNHPTEAKARAVALLPENNRPTLGIKWALEAIRENKKQLKQEAPPKDPDGWRTPNTNDQPLVSLVRKALGGDIWLDPCSDSSSNVPAAVRYYKQDDGLAKHNTWSKTIFINPPFSDPFPWVERCCFEFARGNVSAAIMLLKAGTISNVGTGELINKYASAICHWRGRINFLNDEGNPIKGSDYDCVLIYFGARLDLFRQNFGGRGTIATIENHYSSVNKKFLLKSEIPEFGNTQAEQKQLAAAVGLGNGRSVLPDLRDADRALAERYDPHTVVDVFSSSVSPAIPTPPIPENLVQPIAESEIFDETPLATRQLQKAKENCLNDYVTAISSNLSEFTNEQIEFLLKIINEESTKRIGF